MPTTQRSDVDLDDLLTCIREVVRQELEAFAANAGTGAPTFVDKHESGLGATVFLAAARAGEFETFRVGKRFVARRADVQAYIERQRVAPREPRRPKADEFDVQLAGRLGRNARVATGTTNPGAPPKKVG